MFYERQADRRAIYTIFITVPFQFCSITDETNPFQSGSVFYERTKLTGALYKHIIIFTRVGLYNNMYSIQMIRVSG